MPAKRNVRRRQYTNFISVLVGREKIKRRAKWVRRAARRTKAEGKS
jgi:hypothetical protein